MKKSCFVQTLIETLTQKHLKVPESVIKESADVLLAHIIKTLSQGGKLEVRGFGSFRSAYCPERQMRNPKTGEKVLMSARRRLYFKAGKKLKLRLNSRCR